MTLGKLYKETVLELFSISPTPELDARILIDHALQKDSSFLLSHPEMPLTNAQYSKIRRLVNRRKNGEPIAYITGHKEFYGLDFYVNKNVLIPRPESEELVEQALRRIKNYELRIKHEKTQTIIQNSIFNILDVGTGSGCLIIALAKELDKLYNLIRLGSYQPRPITFNFIASDISQRAIRVARKNAKRLLPCHSEAKPKNLWGSFADAQDDTTNIKFVHSDLFSNRLLHKKFDLIVANLPYVPTLNCHFDSAELAEKSCQKRSLNGACPEPVEWARDDIGIRFEPQEAIFAEDNGIAIIKKFLREARDHLASHGIILLELDPRNAQGLKNYAKKLYPNTRIELEKDLAGLDRYLVTN